MNRPLRSLLQPMDFMWYTFFFIQFKIFSRVECGGACLFPSPLWYYILWCFMVIGSLESINTIRHRKGDRLRWSHCIMVIGSDEVSFIDLQFKMKSEPRCVILAKKKHLSKTKPSWLYIYRDRQQGQLSESGDYLDLFPKVDKHLGEWGLVKIM